MKEIALFGGSGFVGSYVVKELASFGYRLKIISRDLDSAAKLKICGNLGQVTPVFGNILNKKDVDANIEGADAVINLVGILEEKKGMTFDDVHHKAAVRIAESCAKFNVKKFIHFSALVSSSTEYGASKLQGEVAVKSAFSKAAIIRPGVIFGEEDRFFNLFAQIAKKVRMLPLVCRGRSLVQPVYVADVAKFVGKVLEDNDIKGKSYDLVGPKRYTLKDIMLFVAEVLGIKCLLVPFPYHLALFKAFFLELFLLKPLNKLLTGSTAPMLTRDQVKMLCADNISDQDSFAEFGIKPAFVEDIVPNYLKELSL